MHTPDLVEVCDGQAVLAGLIVGKSSDLVAANVVGNQVELAGERIDRPLEIPLSMNTAPLFKWNAAVRAAVTFGVGTVVGEPLFVVSDWE